jgi:hypothetical protein
MVISNGQNLVFREDIWMEDTPLKNQYLTLYNILKHTNVTVAHVMASTSVNLGFIIVMSANKWDRCVNLVVRVIMVQLNDNADTFRWNLTPVGLLLLNLCTLTCLMVMQFT